MLDSARRMQSGGPCWPLEFYPRLQVPSLSSYSQFPRFKAILCFHVFARGVLSVQNTCPHGCVFLSNLVQMPWPSGPPEELVPSVKKNPSLEEITVRWSHKTVIKSSDL